MEQAQASDMQAYGSTPSKVHASLFLNARRKSLNIIAICQSMFVPWFLFCIVSAINCFWLKYKQPDLATVLNLLCLLVPILFAICAYRAWGKKLRQDEDWYPAWYFYLFFMTLFAWLAGYSWGEFNFLNNTKMYLDLQNLNAYVDVDVNVDDGLNIMDGGTVVFKEGTQIDYKHAMKFKNVDTWCAVPIILGTQPPKSYDFWAVGKNCCKGASREFHCPNWDNPKAHAGIRVMQDEERPFYRLAVQQAQATYQIPVRHPLFFYWTEDPLSGAGIGFGSGADSISQSFFGSMSFSANGMGMAAYQEIGFKNYLLGMFVFFLGNVILVLITTCCFAKAGFY